MNKILEVKFGSYLYGTNTPNSDLDFKSIYIPTAREICLGTYKKTMCITRSKQEGERNTKDDVDLEMFSLDRYLELLCQGQTVALDVLFAPRHMYTSQNPDQIWIMDEIYNNRFELLNKNVNAFVGYARQQAAKYGIKGTRVAALRLTLEHFKALDDYTKIKDTNVEAFVKESNSEFINIVECNAPNGRVEPHLEVCNRKIPFHASCKYTVSIFQKIFDEYGARALKAEVNDGIDWKALSHAVRVNSEAIELLTIGYITFPRPDRELLLRIKKGEMPYKDVAQIIEQGLEDLVSAQSVSTLREESNRDWANDLIYQVYSKVVSGGI